MFLNLLSLLVGFLCLLLVILMVFNTKANRKTNIYLVFILFIAGIQRFLNAIEALELTEKTYSPLKIRPTIALFIIPIYYLFFQRLLKENIKLQKELLHFIIPTLFFLANLFIFDSSINHYVYAVFSCFYFIGVLFMVVQFINGKNRSLIEKSIYTAIRTWTFLMTIITFTLVLASNFFLFNEAETGVYLNNFYRFSSILWLFAIVYMLKNPVIIFGAQQLLKNIQSNEPQEFLTWSTAPLKPIEEKDKLLHTNILEKIGPIILNIQDCQNSADLVTKMTLNTQTLAKELKIPRSHLEIIFKYYCHYSVNDFSNLVKVSYAISLIKKGYLEKFTIAHLGEACLFNSRFTFSKNFKKFTGFSVSDFLLHQTTDIKYAANILIMNPKTFK